MRCNTVIRKYRTCCKVVFYLPSS